MTESDLKIIEERAAKATAKPWFTTGESYGASHGLEYEVTDYENGGIWLAHCQKRDDAIFIAASRTDVPALVAEVRRLRALLTRFQEQWLPSASDQEKL